MAFGGSDFVKPLRLAENHFLEVLVSRFGLTRSAAGARLEVAFGQDSPAVWNRAGRMEMRGAIRDFERKAAAYQGPIDDVLMRGTSDSFTFDDPEFAFRWASAGVLPVVRLEGEDYYCFFYREIFPVGWNIANGASDNLAELLNPVSALYREFREEVVVLNPEQRDWYVLECENAPIAEDPAYEAMQAVVGNLNRRRSAALRVEDFRQVGLPLKFLGGPDVVDLTYHEKSGAQQHRVTDCFLNINSLDFGIELDQVAKMNLDPACVICDGEVHSGQLLNRLVGLFRVDRLQEQLPTRRFVPDRFFYDGEAFGAAEFEGIMRGRFFENLRLDLRKKEELSEYALNEHKFDLCPVTRRIVQRHGQVKPESAASPECDVFVSFGRGDEELAGRVSNFLREQCGRRVFYYPEGGSGAEYDRAIDDALETARYLIAVGSRLDRLARPWPEYEYRTFHKDVRNGRKATGQLLSFVVGIDPVDLMLPLRSYAAETCANMAEVDQALARLVSRYF